MVTKKVPEKKTLTRKPITVDALPVRTVKQIKPPHHTAFSYSFVVFLTVIVLLVIEAFFGVPSRWIHDGLEKEEKRKIEACTREYMPVCGKNGKTYPNTCEMENAGITLDTLGECESKEADIDVAPLEEVTVDLGEDVGEPTIENVLPDTAEQTTQIDTTGGWTYTSKVFNYTLTLPKFSYYNVYRTASGKGDVIAVDTTQTGSESSTTALVRITFTKTGDPAPTDAKQTLNIAQGTMSLSYDEPLSKQGREIVDYVVASAR